jgi:hypothetical protein
MGSTEDTVECRINGGTWMKMQRVEEFAGLLPL